MAKCRPAWGDAAPRVMRASGGPSPSHCALALRMMIPDASWVTTRAAPLSSPSVPAEEDLRVATARALAVGKE
jgi:hypothetical protein